MGKNWKHLDRPDLKGIHAKSGHIAPNKKMSPEQKSEAVTLIKTGKVTQSQICKRYKVSAALISRLMKETTLA